MILRKLIVGTKICELRMEQTESGTERKTFFHGGYQIKETDTEPKLRFLRLQKTLVPRESGIPAHTQ